MQEKSREGWNYRMGGAMTFYMIQSDVLDDQVLFSVVPWLIVDY